MSLVLASAGPNLVATADEQEAARVPLPRNETTNRGSGADAALNAPTNLSPLLQPVTLKDDNGRSEQNLVDPFRRRGADDATGEYAESNEDGLMRTTMGEISSEFRILAITIPQGTNTPRTALIQFYTSDEPILVHEGDLVRVDRLGAHGRTRRTPPRRGRTGQNGRAVAPRPPQRSSSSARAGGLADLDLEEQLRKYVFYLNVKHIEPTYIEVYHNKKRPDETIRLNW
jgi:hypothetical protein